MRLRMRGVTTYSSHFQIADIPQVTICRGITDHPTALTHSIFSFRGLFTTVLTGNASISSTG